MYKIHDFSDFTVDPSALLTEVLQKININRGRTVFIVDEGDRLLGSITDGDLRRCLLDNKNVNLNEISILNIANLQPYVLKINYVLELPKNMSDYLIPVLDADEKLLFLLSKTKPSFKLGNFDIYDKSSTLIIAEIGNNHQGSVELARKIIGAAKQAGADVVKFQHRNLKELFSSNYDSFDLGSQYIRDIVAKFQLNKQDLFKCFDYCKEIGIDFTCTPFDHVALADLEEYDLPFYKIASADFLNDGLISSVINTKKPFIISTGMASDHDIQRQIKKISDLTEKFIPLHCNSTYPAPLKDLQMNFMNKIEDFGNGYVGYSGHEQGIAIAIACATRGVKVIEKHFTLDKSLEGNDHKVSLLPEEFKLMVEGIRSVELAFSDEGLDRILSQGEIANKLALGKGIYFNCDLNVGEQCTAEMFSAKSPVLGLHIENLNDLLGRRLLMSVKAGEPVKRDHFYESENFENHFNKSNFYIPVRHADCSELVDALGANRVEFHLSYSDLSLNLNDLPLSRIAKYSVHAPELFENDCILDISSTDNNLWAESVKNLRRVVDFTKTLNEATNINEPVNLVVNVGGASDIELSLNQRDKAELYDNVNRGLHEALGSSGDQINVCIQTMPPYPWHFGGRRFHNLFVKPHEIKNFCDTYGWRVCLDTSHSMMTCNHLSMHFEDYLSKVHKYVDHIHIADCVGVDGEGVITGKGDINFANFKSYYDKNFKNLPLVLEEWQGHMNGGLGFKRAAKYLVSVGFFK